MSPKQHTLPPSLTLFVHYVGTVKYVAMVTIQQ